MGTVYRGVHDETGELHAIKVLAPTYAHDPHFRGRFESEIKSLIQLDHENIVRLLSFGQQDGMLFFSMELVEGNSLYYMHKKGHRFDWREILSVARDVSKGLRHAHDRGIIHRDLKPGNLLMTVDEEGKSGHVKITDFGIAKRFGTSLNTGENVLGTMDFMSPEQAKGEPVTTKSDLYSLGTVMFTLLSGRPPFSANSVEESLRNLTRVPAPRISSMVPDVPRELDELIRQLMAKKPDQRIHTAQALLHRIDEVEATLRDHSEAKTMHPVVAPNETFDVKAPRTEENTNVRKSKGGRPQTENSVPNTIEHTDHGSDELDSATKVDYYNKVDDQIRKKHTSTEPEVEKTKGILPLAFALIAVLCLGGYGIYQAYQPPSAETLYAQIEKEADRPNKVLDEIDTFLKNYPDEERAPQVQELKKVGEAVRLYEGLCNTLTVRSGMKGENRLSTIESKFLEIVELSKTDPVRADTKMSAFVTVYGASDLEPGDKKCLDAAISYKIKIESDTRSKVLFDLSRIKSAMMAAGKRKDTDGAIPVYESIIELYGDVDWGVIEEADEGRALVAKAKAVLKALKAAKTKAAAEAAKKSDETSTTAGKQ